MKIKDILLLLLISFSGYSNNSLAIGIGEIAIQSQLNEPLAAEIAISDTEKIPDANCFSVTELTPSANLHKPLITVRQAPQNYRLVIRTLAAVTEPILNLTLAHHCEPKLVSQYVILLDPQQPANNGTVAANQDEASVSSTRLPNAALPSANKARKFNSRSSSTSSSGNRSNQKKSSPNTQAPSQEEKLTAIYTGHNPANQITQAQKLPRLSISGAAMPSVTLPSLPQPALRLETEINLSRSEPHASLTAAEVMDEITSMDNRLSLLKSQIINLQDKNEKLKMDADKARMALDEMMTNLRIAAGLIALLALAVWIRRRLMLLRAARIQENWFNSQDPTHDASSPAPVNAIAEASNAKDATFNDGFHEKSHYGISSGFSATLTDAPSITGENDHDSEDILESIDVLVEYERYGLAIQILHDYVANHPAESPRIWLKLLALIAEHGTKADYMHTAEKCAQYYRIKLPHFADANKSGSATLEDYPLISKALKAAWGSAGVVALLDDLIYDRESQPKKGFEPEIFEQLFLLKQIAEIRDKLPANNDEVMSSVDTSHAQTNTAENPENFAGSQTSTTSGLAQVNHETPSDGWAAGLGAHSPLNDNPHEDAADEILQPLSFDGYFTQSKDVAPNNTATVADHYFVSEVTDFQTAEDKSSLSETIPALDAPEIDFSQHIEAVNAMQETSTEAEKTVAKPQKSITKDSNLIDWVISDET